MKMSNTYGILREIFKTSVKSVQPYNIIKNTVRVIGSHLWVGNQSYEIKKPVYSVGFGKAVLGMAIGLEKSLGDHLQRGIVSVPQGIFNSNSDWKQYGPKEHSKIHYVEGARNNLPDENSVKASLQIKGLVENLNEDDTVIVLISGGGSALLPLPKGKITLSEKLALVKKLGNSGADILEMNCVRKEISELKGGNLAKLCYPAKVISLILSDVIGDPLDIIASGPTTVNEESTEKAIDILKKYSLYDNLSQSIKDVLEENIKLNRSHISVKDNTFIHVDNYIIGNNRMAAEAALNKAKEMNLQSVVLSTRVSGNVDKISTMYANIAQIFAKFLDKKITNEDLINELQSFKSEIHFLDEDQLVRTIRNFDQSKDICLISAGEPTVVVTGKGLGGRNQQLALSFSMELHKKQNVSSEISFLSCGTDGIDGPTDAAGAIGYSKLVRDSLKQDLNPEVFLRNNDCYNFYTTFQNGEYLVKIGHTGTNVMDIHVILITRK